MSYTGPDKKPPNWICHAMILNIRTGKIEKCESREFIRLSKGRICKECGTKRL